METKGSIQSQDSSVAKKVIVSDSHSVPEIPTKQGHCLSMVRPWNLAKFPWLAGHGRVRLAEGNWAMIYQLEFSVLCLAVWGSIVVKTLWGSRNGSDGDPLFKNLPSFNRHLLCCYVSGTVPRYHSFHDTIANKTDPVSALLETTL